jgi:MFS transporter, PAT family, beta-lactamase induction signal transducer AmpG
LPGWLKALRVYTEKPVLVVLALGFASGLPLALTGATLTFWLAEAGVEISVIGFFAWVGIAYGWKFLWAPVLDRLSLPLITSALGRRRGWLILIQVLLALAILALGRSDPGIDLGATVFWAVVVAFLSASQDIVIDAYRVEILEERQQGAGAAAVTVGYRVAMLASGAGALVLADQYGWLAAYAVMAALLAVGAAAVLFYGEPAGSAAAVAGTRRDPAGWLKQAVVEPFAEFFARNGAGTAVLILLFIVLYKVGDALLGAITSPFYVSLGFAKPEVATIVKTYGLAATLAGVLAGGAVVRAVGLLRGLWVCGIAQMLSNLIYIAQVQAGHDPVMLTLTITVENLTGGMGTAAFVAYLSSLCNLNYTATQYALLSSFMAQARTLLAGFAGVIQQEVGWIQFFVFTTAAAVPALVLLLWLQRRTSHDSAGEPPLASRTIAEA